MYVPLWLREEYFREIKDKDEERKIKIKIEGD